MKNQMIKLLQEQVLNGKDAYKRLAKEYEGLNKQYIRASTHSLALKQTEQQIDKVKLKNVIVTENIKGVKKDNLALEEKYDLMKKDCDDFKKQHNMLQTKSKNQLRQIEEMTIKLESRKLR